MTQELTIYSTGSLLVHAQKRLHLQPEWHLRPAFTHLQLVHMPVLPAAEHADERRERSSTLPSLP